MFNYESPGCTNINGPTNQTISGTMTVANNSVSDFALLSLGQRPPGSYRTYYAGWSRPNIPAQWSVGIHHPRGDIKKISHDYDPVVSSDYEPERYLPDSHWKVRDWDQGTTEPGSSGSSLFDQNRRIVGQLHGGWAACGNDLPDYYGKFSMSWDYGSSSSTRLRDWLDPINSGPSTLDGMEGPPTEPTNVVITNPNQIGMSPRLSWSASSSPHGIAYYQIFRTPSYYNPLNWTIIGTSTSTSYTDFEIVINNQSSAYDRFSDRVAAVDTRGFSSNPSGLPYANVWGDPIFGLAESLPDSVTAVDAPAAQLKQNYPNPFNPRTEIEFNLQNRAHVSLVIYNILGREVARLVDGVNEAGYHRVAWDATDQPSGVYFYSLTAADLVNTRYMILLRYPC